MRIGLIRNYRLQLICQFFLGGIFIYAAIGKILHPSLFKEIVFNYRILPEYLVKVFAIIIPWLEIILGLLLVLGFFKRAAASGLSLLLIVFIAAVGYNISRGLDFKCGCFLKNSNPGSSSGWAVIFRDSLLLIPGILIIFGGDKKKERSKIGARSSGSTKR